MNKWSPKRNTNITGGHLLNCFEIIKQTSLPLILKINIFILYIPISVGSGRHAEKKSSLCTTEPEYLEHILFQSPHSNQWVSLVKEILINHLLVLKGYIYSCRHKEILPKFMEALDFIKYY